MTAETIAPYGMRQQVTAEQYDSWSTEQCAGITYYWRVEDGSTALPVVHTYVLDPATMTYPATEVFTGIVQAIAPFPVELDLRSI